MRLVKVDFDRVSEKIHQLLRSNYVYIFAFVFFTSWIYQVRSLGNVNVYSLKELFFLLFVAITATLIRWKNVKPDAFFYACVLWVVLTVISWVLHQGPVFPYIRRIGQAAFFFLFVTFFRLNPKENPCAMSNLTRWFPSWWVFAISCVFIGIYLLGWLSDDMKHGFGNSSGGFSIWLMQLTALFLISRLTGKRGANKQLFVCILLITPVFVIQVMTGGRTGAIGSLILVSLFSYRWSGLKAMLVSVLWFYLIAYVVAHSTPQIVISHHVNVFRNIEMAGMGSQFAFIDWLDRLSSYRISLLVTAFSSLDSNGFLGGVGLGNFLGWAPAYPALGKLEVHNALLKVLGEAGILGFLLAAFICVLPIFTKTEGDEQVSSLFVLLAYFAVSMVHPDMMLTAINLSFIYLCAFSCLIPRLGNKQELSPRGL